ncbi:MAG: flagellar biosynthesis protein FlhF [Spirochaetaceae bacterium]|nr:flagellar biosynthesis protein FlhF [Spirochaetaceae bacterium]
MVARSEEDCRAKVRKRYGDGVVKILSSEPVSDGLLRTRRTEYRGYITPHPDLTKYAAPVLMGRELETEKKLLAAAARETSPAVQEAREVRQPRLSEDLMNQLLEEIAGLKAAVNTATGAAASPESTEHETILRIRDALRANGFSAAYTGKTVERLRREFSLAALDDIAAVEQKVRAWIGGDILFYDEERERTSKPRIFVLVGPTGVGKTTTLAKIAFACTRPEKANGDTQDRSRAVSRYKQKAALFSIDRYRIGAGEEIEKYGELLGIPYQNLFDREELQKEVRFHREDADIILVDTFGTNPYEAVKLAKMKELLDGCGEDAEYHLALSATARDDYIADTLRAFEFFNYRSVVLTKLDETRNIGGALSCLIEKGKKISFVTTGQEVPYDIERGNAGHFLAKLSGLAPQGLHSGGV